MVGVRPCPYCGGEVEVVKLNHKAGDTEPKYRIQCMHCKMSVARGYKFKNETVAQGKERIQQYEKYIENYYMKKSEGA